jgi:hypothetical protein
MVSNRRQISELTDEQFRARFTGVQAVYGVCTGAGDQLTRRIIGALNPNNEDQQITGLFKIEGIRPCNQGRKAVSSECEMGPFQRDEGMRMCVFLGDTSRPTSRVSRQRGTAGLAAAACRRRRSTRR